MMTGHEEKEVLQASSKIVPEDFYLHLLTFEVPDDRFLTLT